MKAKPSPCSILRRPWTFLHRITQFALRYQAKECEIREHWDKRAVLGSIAGTQDLILKQLEREAIIRSLGPISAEDDDVLEVGCGDGTTAAMVAKMFPLGSVTGIDSSAPMLALAEQHVSNVRFMVGDVLDLPPIGFDHAYSQRCIINLPTWEQQKQAIDAIADRLMSGGRFLMCEHSQDGLDAINAERVKLGMTLIQPPWHNRYFRDEELATVNSMKLIECIPFSATYYFLSRVINAKLAAEEGREPEYDAPINKLALTLPSECVDARFAQGRLWVWVKE